MTRRVLLIISGGIAAYKSLELVRALRKRGIAVRAVLTKSAEQFVTPLSLGVEVEGKAMSTIVKRNTPIPWCATISSALASTRTPHNAGGEEK